MPTLQQLADRGIQTYNGQQYQMTPSGSYVPVNNNAGAGVSTANPEISTLSYEQALAQANQAFSGIVSPMTLADIRAREQQAQQVTRATAEAVYNPQINESQRVGMAKVSTAEGVVGQRQGFNISTAELAFVADTQAKVQAATKEIINQKQAYIDSGNFQAAQRADDQIAKLNEFNANLTIAKANYALQLMAGSREQAQLTLAQQAQALAEKKANFDMSMSEKQLALDIARLTGEYQGSPTFEAKQAAIQNALNAANVTGYYNGQKTLSRMVAEADIALRQQGIEIDKQQLAETIRSNKAQEAIARSRIAAAGSGGGSSTTTDTSPSGMINAAVARLTALRDAGKLTDLAYDAELKALEGNFGPAYDRSNPATSEARAALKSALNKAMEGSAGTSTPAGAANLKAVDWERLASYSVPSIYSGSQNRSGSTATKFIVPNNPYTGSLSQLLPPTAASQFFFGE